MVGRSDFRLGVQGKKPGERLNKVNNAHEAVLKKIGAEFVIYEFRHTFATRFGEAVGDPIALAAILGHANLKTVMKYCHPRESHTAKAMQAYIVSLARQPEPVIGDQTTTTNRQGVINF